MKKTLLEIVALALWCVVFTAHAFGQSNTQPHNAGVRLEAGIAKEEADGDLKAAMAVYQQVANDSSASRAVRAKALLRLAGCEEKLGQQARLVYEQIVKDYADQPVAVQARTRLAALKQQDRPAVPVSMTVRKIEQPPSGEIGASDTDGQRAVYRDANGGLYFGDLAGHSKRLIYKSKDDFGWIPSRDFSLVLLQIPKTGGQILAVVKTDGSGFREVPGTFSLRVLSLSWDKRYILGVTADQRSLVSVRAADGEQRQLATFENNHIWRAAFSPDGRFVAFSTVIETERVFSVPFGGGKAQLLRENAGLLDWTTDGRFLVIATERNGGRALSLQPIENGKALGDPLFIRFAPFFVSVDAGFTTANGSLVYSATPAEGTVSASLSTLDATGHPGPWRGLELRAGNAQDPFPTWSPDGKQILYMSRNDAAGQIEATLILRELSTGHERDIYKANAIGLHGVWSTKPGRIFCAEATRQKTDLLSIALDSGQVERLGSLPGMHTVLEASSDGGALYLAGLQPAATRRWDIATGKTSILEEGVLYPRLSNDENWLVSLKRMDSHSDVVIRPVSGGAWRTAASGASGTGVAFTPDSKWIFYTVDESSKRSLFRVSVMGGSQERLGDYPSKGDVGTMYISPDAREVLAVLYQRERELSILENFVPNASKSSVAGVR
jgi:Tol biopolymer transport system component